MMRDRRSPQFRKGYVKLTDDLVKLGTRWRRTSRSKQAPTGELLNGEVITLALLIAPELTIITLTLIVPFPLRAGSLLKHLDTLTLPIAA